MNKFKRAFAASLVLATSAFACAIVHAADTIPNYVAAAIDHVGRPPTDKLRDAERKPAETILFSGMKPGDKVVDFYPGGGYFTRIFSKVVGSRGKVYAVVPVIGQRPGAGGQNGQAAPANAVPPAPPPAPAGSTQASASAPAGAAAQPPRLSMTDQALAIQNISDYGNVTVLLEDKNNLSLPEQVDIVWTSQNYHDMHNARMGYDLAAFNKAVFDALKPGGVYYVIDHAAAPGTGFSVTEALHRSDKEAVKAEILAAGFAFDGESNVLANPKDNHSQRILDAEMHDNTDQYILKFSKPANTPNDRRFKTDAIAGYIGNSYVLNPGGAQSRTIWYQKDGTYQEFGKNDMQSGTWFFDANGRVCLLHVMPLVQRALTGCHVFAPHQAGEQWTEVEGGRSSSVALTKGWIYP